METTVYIAKCDKCTWENSSMQEHIAQEMSELHMMRTGHTVQIVKV